MLTVSRVFDVRALDYLAIDSEESGADAEFRVRRIRKLLGWARLVPTQTRTDTETGIPSKQDLTRSSCCSPDKVQDLIAAAILEAL